MNKYSTNKRLRVGKKDKSEFGRVYYHIIISNNYIQKLLNVIMHTHSTLYKHHIPEKPIISQSNYHVIYPANELIISSVGNVLLFSFCLANSALSPSASLFMFYHGNSPEERTSLF